jgi:hypothetical protein
LRLLTDNDPINKVDPLGLRPTEDCDWQDAVVDAYIDPSHDPGTPSNPFCAPAPSVADDYIDAIVLQPDTWDSPHDGFQRCRDDEWAISVRIDTGQGIWGILRVEPSGVAGMTW